MTVKKNPMGRLRYSWRGKITFINSKIGKLEGCATIWFLIMKDYEGKEMSVSWKKNVERRIRNIEVILMNKIGIKDPSGPPRPLISLSWHIFFSLEMLFNQCEICQLMEDTVKVSIILLYYLIEIKQKHLCHKRSRSDKLS